jgi:hypothetical protein
MSEKQEMRKSIRVTFSNGSVWEIPAPIVAEDRARYYAEKEGKTSEEKARVFKEETEFCLSDNSEILDWAGNNMKWEDVKAHAVKVEDARVDFEGEWSNAKKSITQK